MVKFLLGTNQDRPRAWPFYFSFKKFRAVCSKKIFENCLFRQNSWFMHWFYGRHTLFLMILPYHYAFSGLFIFSPYENFPFHIFFRLFSLILFPSFYWKSGIEMCMLLVLGAVEEVKWWLINMTENTNASLVIPNLINHGRTLFLTIIIKYKNKKWLNYLDKNILTVVVLFAKIA